MTADFYRLKKLPPYVFAEVNKLTIDARRNKKDIIDFGMGNPYTIPPPPNVIDKLITTVQKPRLHGYSISKGIKGLRKAQSKYYKRRFNVDIDVDSEISVTIGSKEGLFSLALAITGPDDYIVVPSPCYPIHIWGFTIAGSNVIRIKNLPGDDFFKSFKKHVESSLHKPLAVVLNYPCNPTAATVDLEFYEKFVDFCRFHKIYIISDLAYAELYFNDTPPPSILQIKNAKDIAIEFTSISKTYSMAGWRVGFAAGNKELVSALVKMKSYLDYGIYTPIQVASTVAINESKEYIPKVRKIYKERRDILTTGLHDAGWDVTVPDASMFIWTKIPEEFKKLGSLEFSKQLLEKADIAVSPGVGFGEEGEGYVRMSLVENKNRIRQAIRNIKKFL